MTTSSFLAALRAHSGLPLVFRAGRSSVSPGYHLTEVKRVAYETMDCGAMMHRWTETQFELWVPAQDKAAAGRGAMAAGKFLRIVDRVAAELPLEAGAAARIHAAFDGQPAALYDIGSVAERDGELLVGLVPDRTRCKAAERRAGEVSACCVSDAEAPERGETCSAGGCGGSKTAAAVCCA